jgi:L-fuculose-phosphate aldolase
MRTITVMDEHDVRFKIAAARRILYREGCDSNIGGHVSARAEGGEDAFWVTGFEYFDQTTPASVVKLGFDLEPRDGEMELSPAVNFHARIYEQRPDVNGIVHVHSHYISVLSSTGRTVGMYNVGAVLFHQDQATYFDDGHKAHVEVADALGDKRVVLMKNHGAIVASQSVEHATIEAVMLEQSAKYHLECEAIGGTEILEDEVVGGRAMYQKFFLPHMWQANLERLRSSDPDLFTWLN